MPRWGPDADDRLYQAAMQLILDRGYEKVTVAEIAEHAGLKKRSFFRYYADKREVLFAGAADFEHGIVEFLRAAPPDAPPVDVVLAALTGAGAGLTAWGDPVRRRQRVVASSAELRERELIKLDQLSSAIAGVLGERQVDDLTARLVARLGVAVFTTAFEQWSDGPGDRDFPALMDEARGRLGSALAEPDPAD